MKISKGILATLAAAAAYTAFNHFRRRSWLNLRGKVVLVTGGSRGLGLAMAREFGSRGAIIAICARNAAELKRAHCDLTTRGVRSGAFVCDITDREQVTATVTAVAQQFGPVDILVNNAGVIAVGPFFQMDIEDFHKAMNVMFWGTLHTTLAVLPAMRARRQGSIVNITSIGGKISVPHLLPYSCAKFAAVALSQGLRTELAPSGIRVTTIAPGLLRTGSHLNAEFKGRHAAEYAWFAAGAATPLVSIAAEQAARSIVRATVRGEKEKILSVPAELLARLHAVVPGLTAELISMANRMLPSPKDGLTGARTGHDIEAEWNSGIWKMVTLPGRRAADLLNEIPSARTPVATY